MKEHSVVDCYMSWLSSVDEWDGSKEEFPGIENYTPNTDPVFLKFDDVICSTTHDDCRLSWHLCNRGWQIFGEYISD